MRSAWKFAFGLETHNRLLENVDVPKAAIHLNKAICIQLHDDLLRTISTAGLGEMELCLKALKLRCLRRCWTQRTLFRCVISFCAKRARSCKWQRAAATTPLEQMAGQASARAAFAPKRRRWR